MLLLLFVNIAVIDILCICKCCSCCVQIILLCVNVTTAICINVAATE